MRRGVWSRYLMNGEAMARVGPQCHKKEKNLLIEWKSQYINFNQIKCYISEIVVMDQASRGNSGADSISCHFMWDFL